MTTQIMFSVLPIQNGLILSIHPDNGGLLNAPPESQYFTNEDELGAALPGVVKAELAKQESRLHRPGVNKTPWPTQDAAFAARGQVAPSDWIDHERALAGMPPRPTAELEPEPTGTAASALPEGFRGVDDEVVSRRLPEEEAASAPRATEFSGLAQTEVADAVQHEPYYPTGL